jgi:hypothetical protein
MDRFFSFDGTIFSFTSQSKDVKNNVKFRGLSFGVFYERQGVELGEKLGSLSSGEVGLEEMSVLSFEVSLTR